MSYRMENCKVQETKTSARAERKETESEKVKPERHAYRLSSNL